MSRGVARISVRVVLKIFSAARECIGVGGVALIHARTGSAGRCGALCSRFLLIPAIHGILLPAQRGVLEPPEPPPGYASDERRSLLMLDRRAVFMSLSPLKDNFSGA